METHEWFILCLSLVILGSFLGFFGGLYLALLFLESNNQTARELDDILTVLLVLLDYLQQIIDKMT